MMFCTFAFCQVCGQASGSEVILSYRYNTHSLWKKKKKILPVSVIFEKLDNLGSVGSSLQYICWCINPCHQISHCAVLTVQSELLIELRWCVIKNNKTPCNTPHLLILHTPFKRWGTNNYSKKRWCKTYFNWKCFCFLFCFFVSRNLFMLQPMRPKTMRSADSSVRPTLWYRGTHPDSCCKECKCSWSPEEESAFSLGLLNQSWGRQFIFGVIRQTSHNNLSAFCNSGGL